MKELFFYSIISNFLLINSVYIVKKGDTLSKILQETDNRPIYGNQKSLEKTKALNNISDVNMIYEGQAIILPKTAVYKFNDGAVNMPAEVSDNQNPEFVSEVKNETEHHFKGKLGLGNIVMTSKSLNGELDISGGSNQVEIESLTKSGRLENSFKVGVDQVILSKKIQTPIDPNKIVLMNYQFQSSYDWDEIEGVLGVGFRDLIGFYVNSSGLSMAKANTPYLNIGIAKEFDNKTRVSAGYSRFLEGRDSNFVIKNGSGLKLEVSKEIYKFKNSSLKGFINYEKLNYQTNKTKDTSTRSMFGASLDW